MYRVFEELMKEKGVKIPDVARATGINTSTLYEWKGGKYTPKTDKLAKIAEYFGVPLDRFTRAVESEGYYIDPETAAYAQKLADDKAFRVLYDAAAGATPEDLERAAAFLRMLKATNPNG